MATQCPGTTCKTGDDAFVSIIDGIRKKALSHPDSPALSFLPDGKAENAELCSYSRLDMQARAIAAAIQATGQGDGRPVLLMLPPGLEFIAAFFGCLYARAIAVPMTPPGLARMARTFNRLARIVEDSGSRVFITSARLRKAVEELDVFRKNPARLRGLCVELHDLENQADDVYEFFIRRLFEEEKDSIELIKIKEIMQELERTTDAAEHVGKILKNLIVKYV